ncbi:putative Ankyrin repeat and SOCS box protein 3 [Nannochloris sp. 'desiccata']|nr:putative Ankyrin repeat and SOCS box protein 3 [Chlorella desiccata (nom. nud.)]
MNLIFATEWETVLKGKKNPQSSIEFTVVGDASSLQTHLENLVRKSEAERLTKRLKKNDLNTELSEKVDGRTAFHWAVYLNPQCLKVLLEYAARDGHETFKKVMESRDDKGHSPCALAIRNNNLECIMEFIRAGFDFFGNIFAGTRGLTTALAYLVTKTSDHPDRYLENFKVILSELQINPKFDPNMELPYAYEGPARRNYRYSSPSHSEEMEQLGEEPRYRFPTGHLRPSRGGLRRRNIGYRDLPYRDDSPGEMPSPIRDSDTEDAEAINESIERHPRRPFVRYLGTNMTESDFDDEGPSLYTTSMPHTDRNETANLNSTFDVDALMEAGLSPRSVQQLFERADAVENGYAALITNNQSHEGDGIQDEEEAEEQAINDRTRNLLNIAASHGGIEVMRILLELGAKPNAEILIDTVDYLANCPYYRKAAGIACLEALLEAGVDLNAVDPVEQATALHATVAASFDTDHSLIELLLNRGADPTKCDGEGRTALALAEQMHDYESIEILKRFTRLQRLSSQDERIEGRTDEIPEDMACVACLQAKKEVILAPCGHKLLCQRCTKRLLSRPELERRCPTCRHTVESFVTTIYE